jgi:hypothetical protein
MLQAWDANSTASEHGAGAGAGAGPGLFANSTNNQRTSHRQIPRGFAYTVVGRQNGRAQRIYTDQQVKTTTGWAEPPSLKKTRAEAAEEEAKRKEAEISKYLKASALNNFFPATVSPSNKRYSIICNKRF